MFDLGTSFVASVARDPKALAIVDGDTRLTDAEWYDVISRAVAGLDALGLRHGDHLITVLQNRWQAATLHWACQLMGLIITPLNWRAKPDEVEYAIIDSEAKAIVFEAEYAATAAGSEAASKLARIYVGEPAANGAISFNDLTAKSAPAAMPAAGPEDWSLMLYTSGTTAKPKGVPRRHRTERAAAIAHVAQNLYRRSERTLGVMPLYHTMGVRSLLAMSVIGGAFICLSRYDSKTALALIENEQVSNLYLVPTLYHDLINHPDFLKRNLSSVRKLGFAGAPMTDGLIRKINDAFKPDLFVNHYGSSEIYTVSINQDAARKAGSAGRAGINQNIRIVRLGANSPSETVAIGEEGEIIAQLSGDEAFEGYWKRPEATEKSIKDGWYFTGDSGLIDEDGDLFVTGRVDDMIITGGENVSPVEIESCLSLHPSVAEVAAVGLPDERWGKIVAVFIKRQGQVSPEDLDQHCRASGLANFKRPRQYIFVDDIPKSPVGKILRRKLAAGDYETDAASPPEPK